MAEFSAHRRRHAHSWFKFEEGSGKHAGTFRINCPSTSMVLYSRTHDDPMFWNHPAGGVYNDQYWTFDFSHSGLVVKSVDYDIDEGSITELSPITLADQTLTNNSDTEQEMSFSFSQAVTHTSTFDYSLGFQITVGTEIEGERTTLSFMMCPYASC